MSGLAEGFYDRALRPIAPTGPLARSTDPDTSRNAARPDRLTGNQRFVLSRLAVNGPDGLTDFDYSPVLQQTSAGKRRLELERAGLCEYAGTTRLSPSGTPARVYRITTAGLALWQQLGWRP